MSIRSSSQFEAPTLRHCKKLLMKKILSPRRHNYRNFDNNKMMPPTSEFEEFPLFGTENSAMGNSEFQSIISAR